MLEGVDLPVLYAPVSGIIYLHIIITIASAEEIPSKILVFPILNKVFILAYHINTWNGSKQMAKTFIKFNLIKKLCIYEIKSNQRVKRAVNYGTTYLDQS